MLSIRKLAELANRLLEREETVAVAESVTAGLIMTNLSLAENATDFFQGGVTVYNLGQKTRQLGVEPIHAEKMNSVSEQVTQQMAVGVSTRFCSDWGIAITGYAVPVPALKIKTCFAYYCISYKGKPIHTACIDAEKKGQAKVQHYFAENVLKSFIQVLLSPSKK
jgi:nicotinamide-nucleotide amidase